MTAEEERSEVSTPEEHDFDPDQPCPTCDRSHGNHNPRLHEDSAERLGEQLKADGWL
jgi:DNA repair exonuclease SbcCD ATPase subunit